MKTLIAFLLATSTAIAAQIVVTWDPSSDPAVVAHSVRYGLSSVTKTNIVLVTGTNSVSLSVVDTSRIVLDVTAINSIGIKSLPSPEVVFSTTTPPAPTNIRVVGQ